MMLGLVVAGAAGVAASAAIDEIFRGREGSLPIPDDRRDRPFGGEQNHRAGTARFGSHYSIPKRSRIARSESARQFGAPDGWPHDAEGGSADPAACLAWLAPGIRSRVASIVRAGRRIPEEVLGPRQMRDALSAPHAHETSPRRTAGS